MPPLSRVVFHLDVDSFYVACELLRRPNLRGKPVAVTQYNSGGFVAVSNEAFKCGIRKGMGIGAGGQKALSFFAGKEDYLLPAVMTRCPNLVILPMDTSYYRQCTQNILCQLQQAPCWRKTKKVVVEKSSMDDFYIDATEEVRYRESMIQSQINNNCQSVSTPSIYFDPETFVSGSEPESEEEDGEEDGFGSYRHSSNNNRLQQQQFEPPLCPTFLGGMSLYDRSSNVATTTPVRFPPLNLRAPSPSFLALASAAVAHELRSHYLVVLVIPN
jgi:hypothetical protein